MKQQLKETKAITLIALVITIIVLIILAGVSISTLIGENGLITQANEARDNTQKANVIELAQTEILAAEAKTQSGSISGAQMLDILGNYFDVENVAEDDLTAEFPLKTKSEYGNYEVKFGDIYNDTLEFPTYSVSVDEKNILRDIFITTSNDDGNNTITITGIKDDYREQYYYGSNSNFEDGLKNALPTDLLVIPDQIDNNTVTRVEWSRGTSSYLWGGVPNLVKTIIMPNTLISYDVNSYILHSLDLNYHTKLENLVLSNKLKSLKLSDFVKSNLSSITIPAGIKTITWDTNGSSLEFSEHTTINFQGTKEQWKKATLSSDEGNTWHGANVVFQNN